MMPYPILTAGADKMAVTDPHGWTLTIVCVLVVFGCLLILYGIYSLLGAILGRQKGNQKDVTAAVQDQLPETKSSEVHDIEPGIITIRTRGWAGSNTGCQAEPLAAQDVQVKSESSATDASGHKTITSPLPGMIVELPVTIGQHIRRGQKIAVLEAMKMENEILSEREGIITAIYVNKGDTLQEGDKVARIE